MEGEYFYVSATVVCDGHVHHCPWHGWCGTDDNMHCLAITLTGLVSQSIYWTFNALLIAVELFQWPHVFLKYKIQPVVKV
jgi:hypothetical protein